MGKNSKGFTIVEVMIVLAIAGLIIAVVLLAVPALRRNARNNEAKERAVKMYAATIDYMNANRGAPPTCAAYPCSNGQSGTSIQEIARLAGYRRPAEVGLTMWDYPGTTDWLMTSPTYYNIATGVKCGSTTEHPGEGWGHTPVAASPTSFVIIYAIETSADAPLVKCIDSSS